MRKKQSKKRRASNATSRPRKGWKRVFDALDRAGLPEDFMEDRDRSMPQVREAADAAREAGRRLIALGGTMPEIKDVPRRKSDKPGRKR